jgi:hypothetical protein
MFQLAPSPFRSVRVEVDPAESPVFDELVSALDRLPEDLWEGGPDGLTVDGLTFEPGQRIRFRSFPHRLEFVHDSGEFRVFTFN